MSFDEQASFFDCLVEWNLNKGVLAEQICFGKCHIGGQAECLTGVRLSQVFFLLGWRKLPLSSTMMCTVIQSKMSKEP